MIISKKYEVLRQLGQGSMGVVYKVRHTALKTVSALKVLSTHFGDHPDLVKRFYREARVLAHLKHPNIVRVIDIERDEENQFYYFVMEFIEGRTLRQYLTESGPLAVPQVLEITKQVGSALNYAHSYKPPVIHRDIKPTNIMIEDGSGRVVVMDFGIAKDFGDPGLTKAGTILGTLRYCPPEQMRYEPLEGSADIYALGMVMYEMLTGSHLFAALDEYEVVARVATPEEYDLGFPRGTPASFGAIVKKALRKDPSQRYRTMAELLKDVNACCFDMEKTILVPIEGPEFERSPPGDKPEEPTTVGDEKIRTLGEQRERQQVRLLEAKAAEHKEMALRGGAAELVPSVFQAACTAEDQGRAQAQSGQFELACESLEEAIARFKDASEQAAREGLLRQADQARAQMAAAKVEADRYRAQERAHTVYRNGLMLQAKADELWEHQSYREAWEAYGEARSRFEDAQGFAHRSLQEDEAKAAQIKAREAREVAVKHGVEEHAAETFWEAVRAERRGDTVMAQGEYVQARELYQAAETQYARARQKAERERQRQAALTAQAEAQEVRRTVVAMGAMADQEAYRQGQEAQQQGDAHLTEEAFEAAAAAYAGARQRFEQAAALRQRKLAEEAREAAVQAGARERFSEDFAEVGAGFARGAAKEQAGGYGEAAEEYAQAAEGWSRLGEEAQQGLAQEQAEAGRERLEALRAQGTALRSWAAEAWTRADQRAQDAEAIWQQQRYPEAVGLFELAIRASAEACAAAEDARGQQQVVEARTQAERSEGTARAADAPQYARALFVQATLAQEEAGRSLQARRWDDAQRCYAEAHRLYLESREAAERAQVRAAAEAAEKLALAARAALQQAAAPEVFATRIEQAEALFREAQAALGQDHCVAAREGFDRSTALLRQLREEAVVQKARDRAEQARAHALRLQREIGDAGGWRVARAKSALARGHRLFEAANYAGALASFEKAASHFTVRLQATARRRREATPRVAVSWAKVLPFLALGAIAAGATVYFIKAERGPEPPGAALPARPEPPRRRRSCSVHHRPRPSGSHRFPMPARRSR
jgi:predicted Ser/Thr protein kinase